METRSVKLVKIEFDDKIKFELTIRDPTLYHPIDITSDDPSALLRYYGPEMNERDRTILEQVAYRECRDDCRAHRGKTENVRKRHFYNIFQVNRP